MSKSKNKWVSRPLSVEEAAYIAGFVDGEGSIFFVLEKRKENRSGFRITPKFQVSQVRPAVMRWICEVAGGRLIFEDRSKLKGNCQDCWTLDWTPNQTRWLLPQIRPYLIVKAEVCDLMLEFLSLTTSQANYGKYNGERQWEIYQQVRALNSRGRDEYEPQEVPESVAAPRDFIPSKVSGVCAVDDCEEKHYGHGFCQKHYRAEYVNKNPSGEAQCEHCQKVILDRRPDQKYCDSKCRMKAYRSRKKSVV